jgi:hypothetical protein
MRSRLKKQNALRLNKKFKLYVRDGVCLICALERSALELQSGDYMEVLFTPANRNKYLECFFLSQPELNKKTSFTY